MRITAITPFAIRDAALLWVRVDTDNGLAGWGECSPMDIPLVAAHVRSLAGLAIGQSPFAVEALADRLLKQRYKTSGQVQAMAWSGIDIALHDLCGQATGQPLWRLLGGAEAPAVPLYASSLRRDIAPEDEAERLARLCGEHGFGAVKVKIGGRMGGDEDAAPGRSEAVVAAVRRRLGPGVAILADGNSGFSAKGAIAMARRLQPYDLFLIEEPVPYHDHAALARVSAAVEQRVACGEQEWRCEAARALCEHGCDVLQLDPVKALGITGLRRIAAIADAWGAPVMPHQTKPLGLVASLHLHALPAVRHWQECAIEHLDAWRGLFDEPLAIRDGRLALTDRPGLGVRPSAAALAAMRPV